MARHIFQSTLNDQHGNVVVAGKVTVKLSGTSTLATVYESKTGAVITGSVITTGTDGSYLFWVSRWICTRKISSPCPTWTEVPSVSS